MRKMGVTITVGLAAVVVLGAYERLHGRSVSPRFQFATASVGDVVRRVAATGTLEAVTTVEVGSQVSGTISELDADFNSIVHRGQVIARLDPALIDAEIRSARSVLARSEADVQAANVAADYAGEQLEQARALHAKQLIPDSDLDAADVAAKQAAANVESARSQVAEARASLAEALVDRGHTIITAPTDGIVLARNVDLGQTVAAGYQAPTLFIIAADLRKMRLDARIDESDIGNVRVGQPVTFTVDAYPQDEFRGEVAQVRLQPVIEQNVVSYSTEVAVDNADLRLKPGMTATLNIAVKRTPDVLRVPLTALRYLPRLSLFSGLGQAVPSAFTEEAGRRAVLTPGARGFVWTFDSDRLTPIAVVIGESDGSMAQVRGAALREGVSVVVGEMVTSAAGPSPSPLTPGPPRFAR